MPQRHVRDKPAPTGIRGIAIAIFIVHSRLPQAIERAHPLVTNSKEVGWIGVPYFSFSPDI